MLKVLNILILKNLKLKNVGISKFQAHQQAWAWQDEWHHLSIDDIRKLEREAQARLAATFHPSQSEKLCEGQSPLVTQHSTNSEDSPAIPNANLD